MPYYPLRKFIDGECLCKPTEQPAPELLTAINKRREKLRAAAQDLAHCALHEFPLYFADLELKAAQYRKALTQASIRP